MARSGGSASVEPPPSGILQSALHSSYSATKAETSNVLEGRVSLVAINTIVLTMVVFYIWTRGVQGGG
jgi:hypothetical protein